MLKKKKSLGRGLGALLPPKPVQSSQIDDEQLRLLDIHTVLPSDGQPRQVFEQDGINELAQSIKTHGLLQPIVVRKKANLSYEIIAGERRWRASQQAGLKQIKAVVVNVAEKDTLVLALVENLQRRDLNPIEEAEAFFRLNKDLGLTQAEIATAVGKDRATVTNALRLLKLPKVVQEMVLDRFISMGHARALLPLKKENLIIQSAEKIKNEALNVRQTENFVSEILNKVEGIPLMISHKKKERFEENSHERDIRLQLQRILSTKIDLKHKSGKGYFKVYFSSYEELDEVLHKIGVNR